MSTNINVKDKTDDGESERSKYNIESIKLFVEEVKKEFNKIAWPDKKHTVASASVVIVLVMILSFYLASVDLFIGKIIGSVLR